MKYRIRFEGDEEPLFFERKTDEEARNYFRSKCRDAEGSGPEKPAPIDLYHLPKEGVAIRISLDPASRR